MGHLQNRVDYLTQSNDVVYGFRKTLLLIPSRFVEVFQNFIDGEIERIYLSEPRDTRRHVYWISVLIATVILPIKHRFLFFCRIPVVSTARLDEIPHGAADIYRLCIRSPRSAEINLWNYILLCCYSAVFEDIPILSLFRC